MVVVLAAFAFVVNVVVARWMTHRMVVDKEWVMVGMRVRQKVR